MNETEIGKRWDALKIEDKEEQTLFALLVYYQKDTGLPDHHKQSYIKYINELRDLKNNPLRKAEYNNKKKKVELTNKITSITDTRGRELLLNAKADVINSNQQSIHVDSVSKSVRDPVKPDDKKITNTINETRIKQLELLWNGIQDKEEKAILLFYKTYVEYGLQVPHHLKQVNKDKLNSVIEFAKKFKQSKDDNLKLEYQKNKEEIQSQLNSLEISELNEVKYRVVADEYKDFENAKKTYIKIKDFISWFKENITAQSAQKAIAAVKQNTDFNKWLEITETTNKASIEAIKQSSKLEQTNVEQAETALRTLKENLISLKKKQADAEAKHPLPKDVLGAIPTQKDIELRASEVAQRNALLKPIEDSIQNENSKILIAENDLEKAKQDIASANFQIERSSKILEYIKTDYGKLTLYIEEKARALQSELEALNKLLNLEDIKIARNTYVQNINEIKELLQLDYRYGTKKDRLAIDYEKTESELFEDELIPTMSPRFFRNQEHPFDAAAEAKAAAAYKEHRPPLIWVEPKMEPERRYFSEMQEKAALLAGETPKAVAAPMTISAPAKNTNYEKLTKEGIIHILRNGFNKDTVIGINWKAQYLSLLILMYARNRNTKKMIAKKPNVKSEKDFEHWAHCATHGKSLESGNKIDNIRLNNAKEDIIKTIKNILLKNDSIDSPFSVSDEPYLILLDAIEKIRKAYKVNINNSLPDSLSIVEADKIANWAVTDNGISLIDNIDFIDTTIDSTNPPMHLALRRARRAGLRPVQAIDDSSYTPYVAGTRKKSRRKKSNRKQSNRKQSNRKQSRRKQSRRKQSRRKQSRRKQLNIKQSNRK